MTLAPAPNVHDWADLVRGLAADLRTMPTPGITVYSDPFSDPIGDRS